MIHQKKLTMNKNFLITVSAVLLLIGMTACACGSSSPNAETKTEYYNPIGCHYNAVIKYFEENEIAYMRMVSDLNNNFLMSIDKLQDVVKSYYFNNDNICYRYQWLYFERNKKDSIVNWLNTNFEKMPDDSIYWRDTKQNLTYEVLDENKMLSLYCTSEKYQQFNKEDDRIIINFSYIYGYDPDEEEWHNLNSDEQEMVGEELSVARFVIPRDLKGKIEHFRTQGKMLTYEIIRLIDSQENENIIGLKVKDENNEEISFVFDVDFRLIMLVYVDGGAVRFSNE